MPQSVLPDDIDSTIRIMRDFISNPIDLEGKSAKDLLRSKRRKAITRKKRSATQVDMSGDDDAATARQPAKRRKTKRAAELQQFKSAAYIEDSDDAAEAGEDFYARELELQRVNRAKMMALGHSGFGDAGAKTSSRNPPSTQAMLDASRNSSDDEEPVERRSRVSSRRSQQSEPVSPSSPASAHNPTVGARPAPRRKIRRSPPSAAGTASPPGSATDDETNAPASPAQAGSDMGDEPVTLPRPSAKRRIVAESDDDD
jgi:replication fork protection complex subunit Tof1/Swi1